MCIHIQTDMEKSMFKIKGKVRYKELIKKVTLPSGEQIFVFKSVKWLAVDGDGELFGFQTKPKWNKFQKTWDTRKWYNEFLLGTVKYSGDCADSLIKL